jgi:prophage regulatory protein
MNAQPVQTAEISADDRYLTLPQVKERVPKGTTTIYRWIKQGRFPRPYSIGPGSVAWLEREILAWMASHQKAATNH